MSRWRNIFLAIFAVMFAMAPASGIACMVERDFDISHIRLSDVVYRGEVISYEVVQRQINGLEARYATIEFDVIETLKGETREHWKVHWQNSTFELPEAWALDTSVYVAGIQLTSADYVPNDMFSDWLAVVQAPCSRPFFLPDSDESREQLETALADDLTSHDN